MLLAQELTVDQLVYDYDLGRVIEMSREAQTVFPGDKELREMLETALLVKDDRHIYIATDQGTQVPAFVKAFVKEKKNNENYDWCYIYNFEEPNNPKLIKLQEGCGQIFKTQLEDCVRNAISEVIMYFRGKEIKEVEKALRKENLDQCEKDLESLKNTAKEMSFSTHITEKGIFFIPIINGKKINESDYDNLNAEEQETILTDLNKIEKISGRTLKKINQSKKNLKAHLKELKQQIIRELLNKNFEKIGEDFYQNPEICGYILHIKKTLEGSLQKIVSGFSKSDLAKIQLILTPDKIDSENSIKYLVNLVKSSREGEVPIYYEQKINYYDLFGKIEYISDTSNYTTDFTLIQPGLLQLANGGYLLLDIMDLVSNKLIWDKLKKSLQEKSISYDPLREQMGGLPLKAIRPEKMPLNLKVILIGEESLYQALSEVDPEFTEIFSYHIIHPSSVDANEESMSEMMAYLREETLTDNALTKLLEYGIHLTGNKNKLTTHVRDLEKLKNMAAAMAKKSGSTDIHGEHVEQANKELKNYQAYYKKLVEEMFRKNQFIVETSGYQVGQINALSVCNFADCELAYPIRITAVSYAGEEGVMSIEKENKMSGKIFGKGMGVISGYINSTFAKEKPLSMNCSVCFEQLYGDIEGDSASCAEVYVVLSRLANLPLNQSLAVTGSIDQLGNVQPVGCVSTKIEGFYNICKLQGLTGLQGVIIPCQNVNELVLDSEVLSAIEKGEFHLYAIKKVEDAIPLLFNTQFEKIKKIISHNK